MGMGGLHDRFVETKQILLDGQVFVVFEGFEPFVTAFDHNGFAVPSHQFKHFFAGHNPFAVVRDENPRRAQVAKHSVKRGFSGGASLTERRDETVGGNARFAGQWGLSEQFGRCLRDEVEREVVFGVLSFVVGRVNVDHIGVHGFEQGWRQNIPLCGA